MADVEYTDDMPQKLVDFANDRDVDSKTLSAFARYLGVSLTTIKRWRDRHKKFRLAYEQVDLPEHEEYDPEFKEMLKDYFDKEPFQVVTDLNGEPQTARGKVVTNPTEFPTLNGFAYSIGVDVTTLKEWGKKYPDFKLAMESAIDKQKHILFSNALVKNYDSNFSKYFSSNKYDEMDEDKNVNVNGSVSISGLYEAAKERQEQIEDNSQDYIEGETLDE